MTDRDMSSLFLLLRRCLAALLDNRVLAPRAWLATDPATGATVAYLPPTMYDDLLQKAQPTQSPWQIGPLGMTSGALGMPVYRMPESMDKRDYEREWREGKNHG